jgi:hypothetical protein
MVMKAKLATMVVVAACGLGACTTQEVDPMGAGGTSGGAGTSGGGSTGTGGLAAIEGVPCLPVMGPMITDFTNDPDGGTATGPRFGVYGTSWSGGGATYGQLMQTLTGNDWHISGMVTDYSGFNLYFDDVNAAKCNRIDASAYAGIQFTIWGSLPSPNMLTMSVATMANSVPGTWLQSVNGVNVTGLEPGRCIPGPNMMQYYHPDCADPVNTFAVTGTQASPQTVRIMWSGFTGGKPQPNVMPAEITGIAWYVTWAAGATSYAVDLHIDNLAFIPK